MAAQQCGFNTSHVTLYHSPIISKSLFSKCFNTSHVTLYQTRNVDEGIGDILFQYISCYSLSFNLYAGKVFNPWFQYISCYSLSLSAILAILDLRVSIHLMLLFITEHLQNSNSGRHSFNTSHVTLYQFVENGSCKR